MQYLATSSSASVPSSFDNSQLSHFTTSLDIFVYHRIIILSAVIDKKW